jgi:hypothetical protein
VFKSVYHLYMDVYFACEDACLLEKNSRRDEYWDRLAKDYGLRSMQD